MEKPILLLIAIAGAFLIASCNSTSSTTKYQVSVSAVPSEGGSVSPAGGKYEEGKKLDISATPTDSSWKFDHWSGDYQGTSSSATITINKAKNIKAHFSKKNFNLTVNTEGEGTVAQKILETSSVTGYEAGAEVQLTAKPNTGYKFVKWTGDISTSKNPTSITVDKPKEVTAVFQKESFTVNINIEGEGSVTISPDQDEYTFGTKIELSANADQNWEFSEWSGDISKTNNPLIYTINGAIAITAIFSNTTFAGGNGTEANPYKISTLKQLQAINDYPEANFIQIDDINANATKDWNDGKGFKPIGDEVVKFKGIYNGQKYKINNLTINRINKKYIGLFGYVEKATIENVKLQNVTIKGLGRMGGLIGELGDDSIVKNSSTSGNISGIKNTGGTIGGLIGLSSGKVNNSYSVATVLGNGTIGGLVGYQYQKAEVNNSYTEGNILGSISCGGLVGENSGSINNSYSRSNITGSFSSFDGHNYIGGLVGKNNSDGKVNSSHSEGKITGDDFVGGLIGLNRGLIDKSFAKGNITGKKSVGGLIGKNLYAQVKNSYAKGNITGRDFVGGLIGSNENASINTSYAQAKTEGMNGVGGLIGVNKDDASIKESYATGNISGTTDVGGLVGINGASINSSYWDIEATSQTDGVGRGYSEGTTGLKTSEMTGKTAKNFMTNFDFSGTWITSNSYPVLFWE